MCTCMRVYVCVRGTWLATERTFGVVFQPSSREREGEREGRERERERTFVVVFQPMHVWTFGVVFQPIYTCMHTCVDICGCLSA